MFGGPITNASTPFEVVDWSLFDVIGVDHYRNSKVDDHRYAETIRRYLGQVTWRLRTYTHTCRALP